MSKTIGSLLSLRAHGPIGKAVTFRRSKDGTLAIAVARVPDQRTPEQLIRRATFQACAAAWHDLSEDQREYYRQLNPRSNYNAAYTNWMGVCLMAVALDDLTDVEITNPQDGDHLVYDDATGLWKNQPAAGVTFYEGPCNELKPVAVGGVWEEWDISAIVPIGTVAVQLHIRNELGATRIFSARKKGSARLWSDTRIHLWDPQLKYHTGILVQVGADRIIEIYCNGAAALSNFNISGWWAP